MEEQKEECANPSQRTRFVEFAIVVVVAILILKLIGAPTILILETFGLAAILGISAVLVILVFGRRIRFR